MDFHGFVRVAAAVPSLRVVDCSHNAENILKLLKRAESEQVSVVVFPELSLTGYTCADLFQQIILQRSALTALERVIDEGSSVFSGLAVVGLPLAVDDRLFNCAAVFHAGRVLGIIPKSFLPNYKEFYEERSFAPGANLPTRPIEILGQRVPLGPNQLFAATDVEAMGVGGEIREQLWLAVPPTSLRS